MIVWVTRGQLRFFSGKKYCYGSMEGEYCHCDYCKCKHGYGQDSKGHKGCKGHR